MKDNVFYLVNVRDRLRFLRRMMAEFPGGRMSLEGDLSKCAFPGDVVVSRKEIGALKRNTLWPRQDFVVVRLESQTIAPILKQVMAAGLSHAIIHVQIESAGVRQLGAYDNFHPECVVTGPAVSEALLTELVLQNIVREFSVLRDGS
jgi:hypothetical protein